MVAGADQVRARGHAERGRGGGRHRRDLPRLHHLHSGGTGRSGPAPAPSDHVDGRPCLRPGPPDRRVGPPGPQVQRRRQGAGVGRVVSVQGAVAQGERARQLPSGQQAGRVHRLAHLPAHRPLDRQYQHCRHARVPRPRGGRLADRLLRGDRARRRVRQATHRRARPRRGGGGPERPSGRGARPAARHPGRPGRGRRIRGPDRPERRLAGQDGPDYRVLACPERAERPCRQRRGLLRRLHRRDRSRPVHGRGRAGLDRFSDQVVQGQFRQGRRRRGRAPRASRPARMG